MLLGVQYYRPPSPDPAFWDDDFAGIAAAGFDTVQLWLVWGWVESAEGVFDWSDYDRLMDLAHEYGLGVVISTIAEQQPAWLLRRYPDAAVVDHLGRVTPSTTRAELQSGVTPGGSIDDPRVLAGMRTFLDAAARHFGRHPALRAWDCWNENRWAMEADGHLDYSPASLQAFRDWLCRRYGDLDGVARAWRRRFASWDDVQPGRKPGLPYTDLVAFQRFLTERATVHLRMRRDTIRAADPAHPIWAHCGEPSVNSPGSLFEQALSRGNDFALAAELDGYGTSSFPHVTGMTALEFGVRIEATRSAAGDRPFWLAELQGGGAKIGLHVLPPVRADEQQRWIWNGVARGAKGVIVWQWRDEILGRESAGFGFTGYDGEAAERVTAMARTAELLSEHGELLDGYRPAPARVGVLFLPATYQLEWAQDGVAAIQAHGSTRGWLQAFEQLQLPYEVLDPDHLERLDELRLLVLPWPLSVPDAALAAITAWVARGGVLVTEADLGAFDDEAFYRDPPQRAAAAALGVRSLGRRMLPDDRALTVSLGAEEIALPAASWLEEYDAPGERAIGWHDGRPAALRFVRGEGTVVSFGSFPGLAHAAVPSPDFLAAVRELVALAGVSPAIRAAGTDGTTLQWRLGRSGDWTVLFLTGEPGADLLVEGESLAGVADVEELTDAHAGLVEGGLRVTLSPWGVAVLRWR